ncbi:MAG: DUF4298 domain-containing protein [Oscillospiraceae bacterium]|nr:DUF4298 domain-containing protein [Oscillospiraceae bacterium]
MKKLALIFPGIGYTVEKPLLQGSIRIAERLGYEVQPILYFGFPKKVRGDRDKMKCSYELALAQARELIAGMDLSACDELLLIGKSIGTVVAACIAAENPIAGRIRFLLYTPLEETFAFPLGKAVVFTGTADPWVGAEESRIPALCRERGIPCFLTPGGNHSLETGDAQTDRLDLARVMLQTELFLRGQVRPIRLFGAPEADTVLIQLADERELTQMEQEYRQIVDRTQREDFLLLAVQTADWNRELSPWEAPPVFGAEDFGGGGAETLAWLQDQLLPVLTAERERFFYLGGYSLAGLFALWAGYQSNRFAGVAAASPSVWFPDFKDFALTQSFRSGLVYLSLGDREERTRNPVMARVGDAIREIRDYLQEERIPCVLEWNAGNHFRDPEKRTAAGFAWILEQKREQRKRITEHEELLQKVESVVKDPEASEKELLAIKDELARLTAYYESFQWWQDYYDDDSGFLPRGLQRGVLSEDGIYNVLERYKERLEETE